MPDILHSYCIFHRDVFMGTRALHPGWSRNILPVAFSATEDALKYGIRAILRSYLDSPIFFFSYDVRTTESSVSQFFAPQTLDALHQSLEKADLVLDQVAPNLPRWLGETANVAGGGAIGLSDRFVSGFLWVCLVWSSKIRYCFTQGDSGIKKRGLVAGYLEKNP